MLSLAKRESNVSFYEIRGDLLKQENPDLKLRVFYDKGSDILVWENKTSGLIESFQLSFRNLLFIGQSEVIIEWRQSGNLKFGHVDDGSRLLKMTGIIHFKPLVPAEALEKMVAQFKQRSAQIDAKISHFILERLHEGLAVQKRQDSEPSA